ncbi:MAG: iron-sulfur cluster repair di-iron protein [Reichenbachiella sp.]
MQIDKNQTIAQIVRANYQSAEVFSNNNIDFCCGGKISLEEACQNAEVSLENIQTELDQLNLTNDKNIDFSSWENAKLIEHIVSNHHSYVEKTVPYLSQLVDKIAHVHGERHPELIEVKNIFDDATEALYDHMKKEELILFPAIESLEQATNNNKPLPPLAFGTINNPIDAMEHDHDFEGDSFKKIAALTNNFTPPADGCNTYQVAFLKLEEFVNDLHQHIHLENNILFENAKNMESNLQTA